MIKSLAILFHIRKDKADKNQEVPIYCRITVNGERAIFAIKRSIILNRWDTSKGKVKGSTDESKGINAYITMVRNKIYDIHHQIEVSGKPVTALSIKNLFVGNATNEGKPVNLFTVFEEHNAKVKELVDKDFAYRTYEMYQTCLKHLKEFVLLKFKLSQFMVAELNYEFITEFDYFLRSVKSCSNNTTVKYIKNFKKIIRIALSNGWIAIDPCINYRVRLKKVDRGYLSKLELDMLLNKTFSIKRIEQVKDMFVFQCFTGLAYCDAKKLTKDNIVIDEHGEYWIKTFRDKTKSLVNVPLLPKAMEILVKYKDYMNNNSSNYLLPFLSNQKMNAYLKEVADLCGITKMLSSHLGRHTFATTVTLANGVSLEVVSKMLSHTSLNTTKIYARLMDTRVSDEMKVLRNKLEVKQINEVKED